MSLRYALLGLIERAPAHGYQLKTVYEEDVAPGDEVNFGQIYRSLARLEREGLATRERLPGRERPDRKVYTITDSGRRRLRAWLHAPSGYEIDLREESFLKLLLARHLGEPDAGLVIRRERRAAAEREQRLTRAVARADDVRTRLALDLARRRLEAFLAWLAYAEEQLGEAS